MWCKSGKKKTLSALPACWKRSSLNILGIKRRLLLAEHLREQTNRSPGFWRPSYHTGEASAAFTNIRNPVFIGWQFNLLTRGKSPFKTLVSKSNKWLKALSGCGAFPLMQRDVGHREATERLSDDCIIQMQFSLSLCLFLWVCVCVQLNGKNDHRSASRQPYVFEHFVSLRLSRSHCELPEQTARQHSAGRRSGKHARLNRKYSAGSGLIAVWAGDTREELANTCVFEGQTVRKAELPWGIWQWSLHNADGLHKKAQREKITLHETKVLFPAPLRLEHNGFLRI